MSLERISDKNLVRHFREVFEKLEDGGFIRDLVNASRARKFKKYGLTRVIPSASVHVKTFTSDYAKALLSEIMEEENENLPSQ